MADEFTTAENWWESSRNQFDGGTTPSTSSVGSFGWLSDMAAASDIKSVRSSSNVGDETSQQMINLGLSSQMDWNQSLLRGDKASNGGFPTTFRLENGTSSSIYGDEQARADLGQEPWRTAPANFMLDEHNQEGYGLRSDPLVTPNWSKLVPQFLRVQRKDPHVSRSGQLQFSNNAPFWNASAQPVSDLRPNPFQLGQNCEEKPNKNILEASNNQSTIIAKKSGIREGSNKRPRNEAQPLPAFKVRKEKMGDRISALQQLVSPYGKTDTASVLSEAIEYIKLLHEQLHILSTPYMKTGLPMQHHQKHERSKGPDDDLRSRGLCIVRLSSTFPVTKHETNIGIWNPTTFRGTYR